MSLVKGENFLLEAFDGGFYKPFACSIGCSITTSTETIETSVSGQGNDATFVPTRNRWTASADGLVSLQVANQLDLAELRQKQMNHVKLLLHFTRTSETGETYMDSGYGYITEVRDTGTFNGMNTFSIEIQGTGSITQSFVPSPIIPPGTMHHLYINSDGTQTGDTTYTMPANKSVEGAWNPTDMEVITTGTPNVSQIKYDSSTGLLSWLLPLDPTQIIHIMYQDI